MLHYAYKMSNLAHDICRQSYPLSLKIFQLTLNQLLNITDDFYQVFYYHDNFKTKIILFHNAAVVAHDGQLYLFIKTSIPT